MSNDNTVDSSSCCERCGEVIDTSADRWHVDLHEVTTETGSKTPANGYVCKPCFDAVLEVMGE